MAHDIFKQLIEINTTDSVGNTTTAADAMAAWLRGAGFTGDDVQVLGPNPRKGNLVARIHGTGVRKPILFICHLDVVEAHREDWSMDPFQFIEKDGYFYGRGTEDIKEGDAILVTTFIRMKKEDYRPDRDLILALTADEEGGDFEMDKGKKLAVGIQASEKLYQDYDVKVENPGGHSSLPRPDNAIYELAGGLLRLERTQFPFELNDVTRGYFAREADIVGGTTGADMKAILETPPNRDAIKRLSQVPYYNSRMRTTCVATRVEAGHANNALAGTARANVNCRILPGHSPEEIQQTLAQIMADPKITITPSTVLGGSSRPNPPSPLRPDVMGAIQHVVAQMWPGVPVVPVMDAGASDGAITRGFGMPTYGVPGVFIDINDDRSHGRDERLPVASFYEGVDFYYHFIRVLSSPQ
jgi:acetylornithine deacetylase/succinyl-diaminopimelate desuccinylase-like protein